MASSDREHNPRRAVTYARQSKERDDRSTASPEAQRKSTAAHVASRPGWELVASYEDLGRSGYDPTTDRPGLEAALAMLERGEADALVVYRLDRLTRRGVIEAVELVRRIQRAGAVLVSATEAEFDLSTPMGAAIFAMLAAMAEQESANISARTKGAKAVLREAGSHMSGRPPYGLRAVKVQRDGLTVRHLEPDPVTAPHVREVVDRVLAGASVRSEAARLAALGLRTATGAAWTTSALGKLLRSPSLAGYVPATRAGHVDEHGVARRARDVATPRDSRGRVVIATDDDGHLMRPWEGPLEPAVWHRLQDLLDSRPMTPGTTREASLLGAQGLLKCGECGGPMVADRRATGGAYRCSWHRTGKRPDCPGVSVSLPHTESWLVEAVFRRIAALDPEDEADLELLVEVAARHGAQTADPASEAERSTLTAARDSALATLERLDDDRAAGLFDGELGAKRYARQVDALTRRHAEAEAALAALPSGSIDISVWLDSVGIAGERGAGFDTWSLEERREFLALFVDRVEVTKATYRGTRNDRFRPQERFRLWWAGAAEAVSPA
ncbi:recombinase family protein [Promicromonospora sp. NFX87]|uniref:recombinase family protein n=1 Tax=Promicromonospora sp. NFX87 TaxID=3402691 RepID=UPI003AFA3095